jgi:hypothetical protein
MDRPSSPADKPLVRSTRRQALLLAVGCWLLVLLLGFCLPVWHFSKTKGAFWDALGMFRTDLKGSNFSTILADQSKNLKQLGALVLLATISSVALLLFRAVFGQRDDRLAIRLVILVIFLLLALLMIPNW